MRVAAKRYDMVAHPSEGQLLVAQTVVAGWTAQRCVEFGMGQEAECTEAVVDGDHDQVPDPAQCVGVLVLGAAPDDKSAPVNEDHDRQSVVRARRGCEYVERQAVLALLTRRAQGVLWLGTLRTECGRLKRALPRRGRLRCRETQGADRWPGVGDAQEGTRAVD